MGRRWQCHMMDNQKVHVICTSEELLGGLPYTPCFAEWPSDGHFLLVQFYNLHLATRISCWYRPILILWHWLGNAPTHVFTVLCFYMLLFGCMHFCGFEQCWLPRPIMLSCDNEPSHIFYLMSSILFILCTLVISRSAVNLRQWGFETVCIFTSLFPFVFCE
jgi:hypothetical protein